MKKQSTSPRSGEKKSLLGLDLPAMLPTFKPLTEPIMHRFATQYNWDYYSRQQEANKLPSLAEPGQAQSVREILRRYGNGLPVNSAKVPIYNGETIIPTPQQLRRMDLADIQQIQENLQEQETEVMAQINELTDKAKKSELDSLKSQLDEAKKQLQQHIDKTPSNTDANKAQ